MIIRSFLQLKQKELIVYNKINTYRTYIREVTKLADKITSFEIETRNFKVEIK